VKRKKTKQCFSQDKVAIEKLGEERKTREETK